MSTQPERFEVSAAWMKACGKGAQAKVFDVIRRTVILRQRFVILNDNGYAWTVSESRGHFVPGAQS